MTGGKSYLHLGLLAALLSGGCVQLNGTQRAVSGDSGAGGSGPFGGDGGNLGLGSGGMGAGGSAGGNDAGAGGGAGGNVSGSGGSLGTGGIGTGGSGSGGVGVGGAAAGGMGMNGAGGACTSSCTVGATQCLSGSSLQTCTATNGCTLFASTACPAATVCERLTPADCVDPNWAEWPMPNDATDAAAGAPNAAAYVDNGDGTVTDRVTGLMWQKTLPMTAPGSGVLATFGFTAAVAYCQMTVNAMVPPLGGHTDWRLPTLIELVSLVDLGLSNPSLSSTYFPNTPSSAFWSSTGSASSGRGWAVGFSTGALGRNNTIAPAYARCVR